MRGFTLMLAVVATLVFALDTETLEAKEYDVTCGSQVQSCGGGGCQVQRSRTVQRGCGSSCSTSTVQRGCGGGSCQVQRSRTVQPAGCGVQRCSSYSCSVTTTGSRKEVIKTHRAFLRPWLVVHTHTIRTTGDQVGKTPEAIDPPKVDAVQKSTQRSPVQKSPPRQAPSQKASVITERTAMLIR